MAMDGSPSSSTASSGWVLAIFTASVTEPRSDCFKTNLLVTRAEVFHRFSYTGKWFSSQPEVHVSSVCPTTLEPAQALRFDSCLQSVTLVSGQPPVASADQIVFGATDQCLGCHRPSQNSLTH